MNINFGNITLYGIGAGCVIIIISLIPLFISIIFELFPHKKFLTNYSLNLLNISMYILNIGIAIFILSIAHWGLQQVIHAFSSGEYSLAYGRPSAGKTYFTWESNPILFIFQTTIFITFYIWSIYYILKKTIFSKK